MDATDNQLTTGRSDTRDGGTLGRLTSRWPTAAGIAMAALTGLGIAEGGEVAAVVTASGFVYLGAAALRRRSAAWPMFLVSFVVIAIGNISPGVDPTWWLLAVVTVLVVYGLAKGALRPAWGVPLQLAAMVVLATTAIVAVQVGATWAGVLVAAGLLAHAAWDVHHHRVERVVARSMAEFCAVLDTVLALIVLAVTFA
ncbi:MAG: hypothetical protein ACRDO1_11750 [Nocardioidaceae bacterium]